MDLNYLLSEFAEDEVIDIVRLYISKALFTDEPEHVFKAVELLEELYKVEMEKVE